MFVIFLLNFYCDFYSCILLLFYFVHHQALFQKIDYQQFSNIWLTLKRQADTLNLDRL